MAVAITQTANPAGVAASGNVATYSAASIGTASADRLIVLCVASELASASPNSATIDFGTGAQTMSAGSLGNFGAVYARLFYYPAPTGTTANFAITFGANPGNTANHIAVYSITGADFVLLGSNNSNTTDYQDVLLTTGSITIPNEGGFICVIGGATATAKTVNNATKDIDTNAGTFEFVTATRVTALTATAITSSGGNNEDAAMSWASFQVGEIGQAGGAGDSAVVGSTGPATSEAIGSATGAGDGSSSGASINAGDGSATGAGVGNGAGTAITAAIASAQGRASDVVLLLHMDGPQNSGDFFDAIGGHAVGNFSTTIHDITQPKFGVSAGYFAGDTELVVSDASPDFVFGLKDFTIDFWVNTTQTSAPASPFLFSFSSFQISPQLYMDVSDGTIHFYNNDTPGILGTVAVNNGNWHHIAVARANSITKLFIDGNQDGSSYSDTNDYNLEFGPSIGCYTGGGNTIIGFIDEFRIINGRAAWTSNFTPPTSAYVEAQAVANVIAASDANADGVGSSSIHSPSGAVASAIGAGDAFGDYHAPSIGAFADEAGIAAFAISAAAIAGSKAVEIASEGQATGTGASNFVATAIAAADAQASGVGSSDFVGSTAGTITSATAEASGTGSSSVAATEIRGATASADGAGSSNVADTAITAAQGQTTGTGSSTVSATEIRGTTASASGNGSANGFAVTPAQAQASGTGDANALSEQGAAIASASGAGASNIVGAQIAAADGSAAGIGASSVNATEIRGTIASASGTGASTTAGAQIASATAAASGSGSSSASSEQGATIASATGTGTASATGNSIAAATASASGTGSSAVSSEQIIGVTATASGAGLANATGSRIEFADGTASGTGQASAVGFEETGFRSGVGVASGTGTAAAISSFTTRRITTSTWVARTWPSRPQADEPERPPVQIIARRKQG